MGIMANGRMETKCGTKCVTKVRAGLAMPTKFGMGWSKARLWREVQRCCVTTGPGAFACFA